MQILNSTQTVRPINFLSIRFLINWIRRTEVHNSMVFRKRVWSLTNYVRTRRRHQLQTSSVTSQGLNIRTRRCVLEPRYCQNTDMNERLETWSKASTCLKLWSVYLYAYQYSWPNVWYRYFFVFWGGKNLYFIAPFFILVR